MDDRGSQDRRLRWWLAAMVAVLALGGAGWWYWQHTQAQAPPAADPSAESGDAVQPQQPVPIRHPLTPEAAPAVANEAPASGPDTDTAMLDGIGTLLAGPELLSWLIPDKLARRLVATTDNLSRNARTEQLRPLQAPGGAFGVTREVLDATIGAERITLSPLNAGRYDAPVALLSRIDMKQAADLYRRLYPLLQRAYEDLGYPGAYFNDRVVDTIDHLLETPEPAGPLLLEQPKVLYRYADPELESRSAGQKLLLRMGVAHARTAKQKMREFRGWIAGKE